VMAVNPTERKGKHPSSPERAERIQCAGKRPAGPAALARRDFLQWALAIPPVLALESYAAAQSTDPADVIVVEGASPYDITKAAVSQMGGMKKFVSRQSVVLIKPNIGFPSAPKVAATTNPDVVRALIELAFEAGAKTVRVMDNPVGYFKPAYERSGIQAVVLAAGAEMVEPDPKRLVSHNFGGGLLKGFTVFRDCVEVDTFINVPILKTHSMTGLTLGMKNLMGIVEHREIFHGSDKGDRISELARGFVPHLNVMDAWRFMRSGGPESGPTTDIKRVLVSTKLTELDTVAAAMVGVRPSSVPYIASAGRKKMGEIDASKVKAAAYAM